MWGPKITLGCPDSDGDGIADKYDDCKHVWGHGPGGCPEGQIPPTAMGGDEGGHIAFHDIDYDNDGLVREADGDIVNAGPRWNNGMPVRDAVKRTKNPFWETALSDKMTWVIILLASIIGAGIMGYQAWGQRKKKRG